LTFSHFGGKIKGYPVESRILFEKAEKLNFLMKIALRTL